MLTSIFYTTIFINQLFCNTIYKYRFFYQNVIEENTKLYKEQLMQLLESSEWNNMYSEGYHHLKQLLQKEINKTNEVALMYRKR